MKNSSIENRFCMSLVAFAVIVRLLLATGAAAAVDEAFGRAPQAQAPEPDILTLEILAAPEPIVPPEPEPQPEAEPEPGSPEPAATRRTSRRCSCSRAASIFSRTGRPS